MNSLQFQQLAPPPSKNKLGPLFARASGFFTREPESVGKLRQQVTNWIIGAKKKAITSVHDLGIEMVPMGLSSAPDTHTYLLSTAHYARDLEEGSPKHQEILQLMNNGLKGLTLYSLFIGQDKTKLMAYNGIITACGWLLSTDEKGNGLCITPESQIEDMVCTHCSDAFSQIYEQKKKDGYDLHMQYLFRIVGEYASPSVAYTDKMKDTITNVFKKIYRDMDSTERLELKKTLNLFYDSKSDFASRMNNLMNTIETYEQASSQSKRKRPSPSLSTLKQS
ncbi:MAG: hypothetical protein AB7S81_01470 [Bdellovibrionales bacterium]